MCFKSRDEIFLVDHPPKYQRQACSDIYRKHDCREFAPYEPGYAPKEFQEFLKQKWLQEREDRRDDAQRKWQQRQSYQMIAAIVAVGVLTWALNNFF
ncbi:MAG: hypothetical protein OXG37_01125 [Actinomycetia bacterium]|nr:hypothetical protein [Actinomycetes bacterium]